MEQRALLIVGVGDIHGRFHRVEAWLEELEASLGRPVDVVLAVGDVEAFRHAGDQRRKAAKRKMPAEFAAYADGQRRLRWPLYFIGGNNEDFEALHDLPEGGELAPNVYYLGRAGQRELRGLRVAWLSGIYAPRFYEQPLQRPRTLETAKQAGYFRQPEVERVEAMRGVDLMLVHEWPRGLPQRVRGAGGGEGDAKLPSYWIGNTVTRRLVERVGPGWLLCGHSHRPFAVTLGGEPGRAMTRVACLDQAARPEGAIFWLEYEGRRPVRAGWGTSGREAWRAGQPWGMHCLPAVEPEPE